MKSMNCTTIKQWIKVTIFVIIFLKTEGRGLLVETTYLTSAVAKGAVCLDGSAPAYNLHKGYGSGIDNWLVHVEGGGWCHDIATCLSRKNSKLGSSQKMVNPLPFSAIMTNNRSYNPDFYNWNRVKLRYCDGASFTGDVEAVDPKNQLHFRGARIWTAIMEDLLSKGMKTAKNALLSGCSAGGTTALLHCDSFRSLFPAATNVKCLSDAGYFINVKDISGNLHFADYFQQIVKLHGSEKNLPESCTSTMRPELCFFPEYVVPKIQTPIFILNAAYDPWQIKNLLVPPAADPKGDWKACKISIQKCSTDQIKIMEGFRKEILESLKGQSEKPSTGLFINSCSAHCQTEYQATWLKDKSPVLQNTTIAESVADWFYGRRRLQMIDCPYPCDRTCQNLVYDPETSSASLNPTL